jgi:hypothetical protein
MVAGSPVPPASQTLLAPLHQKLQPHATIAASGSRHCQHDCVQPQCSGCAFRHLRASVAAKHCGNVFTGPIEAEIDARPC